MNSKYVFISHSSKNRAEAQTICDALEQSGIQCWMAPRDIVPGDDWTAAIVSGIEHASALILVFSTEANKSVHVENEVSMADSKRIPIVPVRLEDAAFTDTMNLFLRKRHRFDALHEPLEKHLGELIKAMSKHLAAESAASTSSQEADKPQPGAAKSRSRDPLPPAPLSHIVSVAVRDFTNSSPESANQFIADGIATELRDALSKVHRLRVAARSAGADADFTNGRDVRFVISGDIRCLNDQVRVSVVLDNAEHGVQIWSRTYDGHLQELFALQERIAVAVASEFGGARLRDEIATAAQRPTESLDAWSLVQRARSYVLAFTPDALEEAVSLYRQAIALDSEYAAAHAGLASVLSERVLNGLSSDFESDRRAAIEAADFAFATAPADPFVLKMCGLVWAYVGEFEDSLRGLRRAVSSAPFDFGAWGYMGWPLAASGEAADLEEIHQIMERILAATPQHPGVCYWLYHRSVAFVCQADSAAANRLARDAVEQNPMFPWGWMHYANVLGLIGESERANRAAKKCLSISPALTPSHYERMLRVMAASDAVAEPRLQGLRLAGILV